MPKRKKKKASKGVNKLLKYITVYKLKYNNIYFKFRTLKINFRGIFFAQQYLPTV